MTDVPLKEYTDARLREFEKRLNERFDAQEKATRLAVAQAHLATRNLHWISTTAISILALAVALAALFLRK